MENLGIKPKKLTTIIIRGIHNDGSHTFHVLIAPTSLTGIAAIAAIESVIVSQ